MPCDFISTKVLSISTLILHNRQTADTPSTLILLSRAFKISAAKIKNIILINLKFFDLIASYNVFFEFFNNQFSLDLR